MEGTECTAARESQGGTLEKVNPYGAAVSTEGGWWGIERELGKHATEMGTCQVRVSRWACTTANFQR